MRFLLLLVLTLGAVPETEGVFLGLFESSVNMVTNIAGTMSDWGITTTNGFVDNGFKIGGAAIGAMVDPFGWWKPSVDDHGHLTGKVTICPARSDIVFVIDTSGSVNTNEFDLAKQFASRLTEHFQIGINDVQFAAITFSDRVQKVFDFNTHSKREEINLGVLTTPFLGGNTKTYLALDYVRQQNIFSTSNGAREQSSKIVVIITDGSSDSLLKTTSAADALKRAYHVISVGIGSGLGLELQNIASGYKNVFTADTFSSLIRIEQRVARRLCEIPEADGNIPQTQNGCSKGFQENPNNPSSCVDINECTTGSHSCEQNCVNIVGSYRCTCRTGSVINPQDSSQCLSIQKCQAPVDIIFALDASGSIGTEHFKTQQIFVAKLVHHFSFGANGTQFGGLLFANDVQKLFDLNTYVSRTDVTTSLLGAPYIEGVTNTHLAMRYIADNELFSPAWGGRADAPDIVVIVTDGNASNKASTYAAAADLKSQGVTVFAVGIGEQVDLAQLSALASSGQQVLGAVDFELLDYIEQPLADAICDSVGG